MFAFGAHKRETQALLNKKLSDRQIYQEGLVLSLAGPNPSIYLEAFKEAKIGEIHHIFEENNAIYFLAKKDLEESFLTEVCLFNFNILDLYKDQEESEYLSYITGIDLDFCKTISDELILSVGFALERILRLSCGKNIWIRISGSIGPMASKAESLNKLGNLTKFISNSGYKITCEPEIATYADGRAMLVYQFEIERNEMKKVNTMKTLSTEEANMVRDLMNLGHDPAAIAKKFNLAATTVTALKAVSSNKKTCCGSCSH